MQVFTAQEWRLSTTQGGTTTTLLSNVSYSGAGGAAQELTGASLANGVYTEALAYDALARPTESTLTRVSDGALLFDTQRAYDAVGNVANVWTTLPTGTGGTDYQAFCYDEQNRLVWVSSASGTVPCNGDPTWTAGSLAGGATYTKTYSYDTLNRLTSGPLGSYTYGDSAHLDAATAITGSSSGYSASYDAAGDMVCRAPTSATTCTGSSPTGAQLSYDNERRLASWQNAPGSTPTSSTAGTTTTTSYYYAGGKRIAQATNGAFSYLGSDNLGSAEVALDGSGNVQASALYDPYGNTRYTSGTMPGSYGYTGQRADNATGLDDYNARYYDPVLGQFASADSTAGDGLNRYAYVGGNPETATDPTGNYRCDDTGCTRGGGNHGSGGCTFDCGGGSSGSSGGGTGGGKGAGSGSAGGGSGSADHNPAPQETSCVGALLVGYCYSLDVAEALGQRINFVEAWFSQFAAGWGTAEAAFMMWMSISGRMAHSPFWEGVDGDLIANMWVAAVEFEAGVRTTGNAIIQNWLSFMATPSTAGFWLAHNGSIMAGAWSSQGLEWFGAEPPQEQLFINDALVNLLEGTYATTLAAQFADSEHLPGWLSGIAHGCDPSTNCIGIFLYALYPTSYPVPWTWFATPFGAADTAYACQAPVMPIAC